MRNTFLSWHALNDIFGVEQTPEPEDWCNIPLMSDGSLTGWKMPEEIKRAISEANKDKPKTEEHKKATSVAMKLAYQSEEVRERCREARKNNKKVICIETGEVYRSITEAARCCNLHRNSVRRSVKNGTSCRVRGAQVGRCRLGEVTGVTFSYT